MNPKIDSVIENLVHVSEQSFAGQNSGQFQQVGMLVNQLQNQAREQFQADAIAQYGSVLRKLDAGDPLTSEEQAALELLVVGHAKYYLKEETDFNSWIGELKRLVSEIDRIRSGGDTSLESLMELQALCTDAGRVVADIAFYLEEKERYQRFQESTREIDLQESAMLSNIIRSMLGSGMM